MKEKKEIEINYIVLNIINTKGNRDRDRDRDRKDKSDNGGKNLKVDIELSIEYKRSIGI